LSSPRCTGNHRKRYFCYIFVYSYSINLFTILVRSHFSRANYNVIHRFSLRKVHIKEVCVIFLSSSTELTLLYSTKLFWGVNLRNRIALYTLSCISLCSSSPWPVHILIDIYLGGWIVCFSTSLFYCIFNTWSQICLTKDSLYSGFCSTLSN
jgi:hypothetical protein